MIGRLLLIDRVLRRISITGVRRRGDMLRLRLWHLLTATPWTHIKHRLTRRRIRQLEQKLFGN